MEPGLSAAAPGQSEVCVGGCGPASLHLQALAMGCWAKGGGRSPVLTPTQPTLKQSMTPLGNGSITSTLVARLAGARPTPLLPPRPAPPSVSRPCPASRQLPSAAGGRCPVPPTAAPWLGSPSLCSDSLARRDTRYGRLSTSPTLHLAWITHRQVPHRRLSHALPMPGLPYNQQEVHRPKEMRADW